MVRFVSLVLSTQLRYFEAKFEIFKSADSTVLSLYRIHWMICPYFIKPALERLIKMPRLSLV